MTRELSSAEWLRNLAKNYADGVAGMTPQDHHAWDIADEIERLWAALQRIVEHYDMRSDMYTNDADLAECLAEIARHELEPKLEEERRADEEATHIPATD